MMSSGKGNYRAALAYALGFFTAIPILLRAGGDRTVKFHAWQSIIWSFAVAGVVVQVLGLVMPDIRLLWLFVIVGYLFYGAVAVAAGREFRMPLIGGFVEHRLVN